MSGIGSDIMDNPALGLIFGVPDEAAARVTVESDTDAEPVGTSTLKDVGAFNMRVLSCNVQNTPDLSRAKVKGTGKAVSHKFTVGGFQELGEHGQDRADVLSGLGPDYALTQLGNADVQTQIGYLKKRLDPGRGGYEQAVPGGQPYPNPPRGWVWQEFTPEHGPMFMLVNTHFVNRAWNAKPDEHKALRKKNWNIHFMALSQWLRKRADSVPIILNGDFNRIQFPMPVPGMRVLAGAAGIDKILVSLPQGYRVKGGVTFHVPTPSDHNAIGRELQLERKRAS